MAVITKKDKQKKIVNSKKLTTKSSAKKLKLKKTPKSVKPIKTDVKPPKEKRVYNKKKNVMSSVFISNTINEQSKKVKAILKANHLQHKVRGMGDYDFSKTGGPTNPVFKLNFSSEVVAKKVQDILSKKYHYDVSLEDKIISVAVFKNEITSKNVETKVKNIVKPGVEKITKVTPKSPNTSQNIVDKFTKKSQEFIENEQKTINKLRERAKRIVGLIKHKFDIHPIRKGKTIGYSAGKIHQASTAGYNIRFSSEEMARKVCAFLESEHYDVSLNHLQLTISLTKEPKQVEQEKHEQTSGLQKIENLVKATNDTLEKARTHGLSIEEIGARIFDYMHNNNIVIMEAGKKISIRDIVDGVKLSPVDKEEFVSIIVVDALK